MNFTEFQTELGISLENELKLDYVSNKTEVFQSMQFLGSGMAVEFRLPMFNYGKRKEIKYLPGSTWKKGWAIQVLILPLSKILNRPKFDELWEFHKQNQLS